MKITIIIIGDEILLGRVTDTNSGFIARTIGCAGWSVGSIITVGDNSRDILCAIEQGMAASDIVITTGGLGPTKDDITKSTLCSYFNCAMHLDKETLANVTRVMEARGRELNELTRTQAIVPDACTVIRNKVGTAPIMWFERNGKVLVTLPGVPFEAEEAFTSDVFPRLLDRFAGDCTIEHRSLIVTGMSESHLAETIADIEDSLPIGLHLAYLPSSGYVHLRLDGISAVEEKEGMIVAIEAAADALVSRLGDAVIARKDALPAEILLAALKSRGLTCATAESCTGGNIAHSITLIPGSSEAFMGGAVTYSNEAKTTLLGVNTADIARYGAVSIPVVRQMAEGARRALNADIGIATSGIAGPGGATPDKPVGTVCIAVATPAGIISHTHHFPGNRTRVINHATTVAIIETIKSISKT